MTLDLGPANLFDHHGERAGTADEESADYQSPPAIVNLSSVQYHLIQCQQDKGGVNGTEVGATAVGFLIMFMNLLAIVLICRNSNLHRALYFCICNLAVADFLAGLLLFWIFFLQKYLPFRSPYSDLIQKNIWVVTVWSSFLNQLLIALDRYFIFKKRPTNSMLSTFGCSQRKWGIIIGLILTWLIPITTFMVPVISVWHCANHCHCYSSTNATSADVIFMFCFPIDSCSMTNPPFTKGSMLFMGLFLVAMPILPCVLYAKIFRKVQKSSKRLRTVRSRNSIPMNSGDSELQNFSRSAAASFSNADDSFMSSSQPQTDSNGQTTVPYVNSSADLLVESRTTTSGDCQQLGTYSKRKSSNTSKGKPGIIFNVFAKNRTVVVASNDALTNRTTPQLSLEERRKMRKASSVFFEKLGVYDRDIALFKTLVIILACYIFSTVPLGLLFLVSYGEIDKRYVVPAKNLLIISLINSLLNPIIYMLRFEEMKKDLKKLFCLKTCT